MVFLDRMVFLLRLTSVKIRDVEPTLDTEGDEHFPYDGIMVLSDQYGSSVTFNQGADTKDEYGRFFDILKDRPSVEGFKRKLANEMEEAIINPPSQRDLQRVLKYLSMVRKRDRIKAI